MSRGKYETNPGFDLAASVEMRNDLRNGSKFWPLWQRKIMVIN